MFHFVDMAIIQQRVCRRSQFSERPSARIWILLGKAKYILRECHYPKHAAISSSLLKTAQKVKDGKEIFRWLRFKAHLLSCGRVEKPYGLGVKGLTGKGLEQGLNLGSLAGCPLPPHDASATVCRISKNRMMNVR